MQPLHAFASLYASVSVLGINAASCHNCPSMTWPPDAQEVLSSSSSVAVGKRWSDQDAKAAADALVAAAISKGTLDNVTAIVCLLPWD